MKEANIQQGGFVAGSYEWGQEDNSNCGRVAVEENDVSKSSTKCRNGLYQISSVAPYIVMNCLLY